MDLLHGTKEPRMSVTDELMSDINYHPAWYVCIYPPMIIMYSSWNIPCTFFVRYTYLLGLLGSLIRPVPTEF